MSQKIPLPVGTQIRVNVPSFDTGIMSWDDTDTEIEREAPAGSICYVTQVEKSTDGKHLYHVEFVPSEVWNILDEDDLSKQPENFVILALGYGFKPKALVEHYADPVRDPAAVRKIAAENGSSPKI